MKKFILLFVLIFGYSMQSKADLGFNFGMGLPYLGQYGLDYTLGKSFTLSASQNSVSVTTGEASVDLSMPQILLNWHPFQGAFYIAAGVGSQSLDVEAVEAQTGLFARASVNSNTNLARIGWMWGKDNSGFWFGMDLTYIMPSGASIEIESNGFSSTDEEYKDVETAAEDFGDTSYINITFARFGWLF